MGCKIEMDRHERNIIVLQRPLVGIFIFFKLLKIARQPVIFPLMRVRAAVEFFHPL